MLQDPTSSITPGRHSHGKTPARSNELLPQPLGPTIKTNGHFWVANRFLSDSKGSSRSCLKFIGRSGFIARSIGPQMMCRMKPRTEPPSKNENDQESRFYKTARVAESGRRYLPALGVTPSNGGESAYFRAARVYEPSAFLTPSSSWARVGRRSIQPM